ALELLAATWKEESPDDRAAFVSELATNLSTTDEAFLESALDDKRKEVRRAVASLVGRLAESALVLRMIERVHPLLKFSPGESGALLKLKRARKPSLEVTLPAECTKAMQRDGIEPKPKPGFGEKAWWLIQSLEVTPLDLWTREWNTTPADIMAASEEGEWKKELFEAWTRAAIRQKAEQWAYLLFQMAIDQERYDKASDLFGAMTASQQEAQLGALLAAHTSKVRDLLALLFAQCGHAWSSKFSREVLLWLRSLTSQPSSDWMMRQLLKDLATRLA